MNGNSILRQHLSDKNITRNLTSRKYSEDILQRRMFLNPERSEECSSLLPERVFLVFLLFLGVPHIARELCIRVLRLDWYRILEDQGEVHDLTAEIRPREKGIRRMEGMRR